MNLPRHNITLRSKPSEDGLGEGWCANCGQPCKEVPIDESFEDGRGFVRDWGTGSECCECDLLNYDPLDIEAVKEKVEGLEESLRLAHRQAAEHLRHLAKEKEEVKRLREQLITTRGGMAADLAMATFSGQCGHGRPIGQNCDACGRKH